MEGSEQRKVDLNKEEPLLMAVKVRIKGTN